MTDTRLTFVGKGLAAFFGFLLLFFGVSAYFGGGLLGIGVSVALAIVVAGILVKLWPRLREQTTITPPKMMTPPQDTAKPPATPRVPVTGQTSTELCNPGPYIVGYGDTVKIPLAVKAGDKIEGYVRDINNDFFDWFIVDEDEMVRFFDRGRCKPVDGERNVTVSKVNCRLAGKGPYYLLLDIGTRLNDRQVEVVLRRSL